MVKWMHYLAVAMLLAAVIDVAAFASSADVAGVDVVAAAPASNTGKVITLTQFSWIHKALAEKTTRTADETTYESLKITFKEDALITTTDCSIIYRKGKEPEINYEGTLADSVCTIDLELADKTALPAGKIEYELGITDENGNHYTGAATFTVDRNEFVKSQEAIIACGSTASYTRTVEADEDACTLLGGTGVSLDKTQYACYVTVGRAESRTITNGEGCISLPDAYHATVKIDVCLSDTASVTVEEKPVTGITIISLTYGDTDGSLAITYADGAIVEDNLEVILQDTTADSTTFYVGVVDDLTAGQAANPLAVTLVGYEQTSATYEVCGVLSITETPQYLQTVGNTDDLPIITDLNMFMMKDVTAKLVEFGFNNVRTKKADRKYYATLTDGFVTDPVEVGINCVGVKETRTCYGFLSTEGMEITVPKTLTVGYGNADADAFDDPANMIIGTLAAQ